MTAAAIEIDHVSKKFRLYRERPSSLKARLISARSRAEDFWALKEVDFDISEGEFLGLIGHNGSGKTTLLKIIAGILRPTSGIVRQRGRLAALLELGAGFHPELTGRENVYLNASFLGLSRRETDRVYEGVVDFAELADFMDNPVKFYSSGMLVRLGFAVAVHVDPEVLLIDEVLAVGDEAFQKRCIDRIQGFQRDGRTIVLVTHALDTVRQLCDRAVMLDHGNMHAVGAPDDVVHELRYVLLRGDPNFVAEQGTREVEIAGVELIREGGSTKGGALRPGEALTVQVDVQAHTPVADLDVSFAVLDGNNRLAFDARTAREGVDIAPFAGKKRVSFHLRSVPLLPGRYWVTVGLSAKDTDHPYHVLTQRWSFDIEAEGSAGLAHQVAVALDIETEDL